MMEPVAWLTKTRMGNIAWATWQPAGEPLVRLSDAEARIAVLEAENAKLKSEREEADHKIVDRYRDPKTGTFSFPGDVAAIVRRLDAAEALLKEADTLAKIAIGAEKMMNGAAIYFAADGERDDAKKLTKVATIMGEHARALRSKIGVKDE